MFKKWWLLWKLRERCYTHSKEQPLEVLTNNQSTYDYRNDFVDWIARCSLSRWSGILRWRKKSDPEKLKEMVRYYNPLINSCIKDCYIEITSKDGKEYIRISSDGEEFLGFIPFLQVLLSKYYLAWTIIIVPLIIGAYGSYQIHSLINLIWGFARIYFLGHNGV